MSDREKLIELIGQVQYLGGLELPIADYLISNGVTFKENEVSKKEYNLCADNALCCDDDCQKCASRIYKAYCREREKPTQKWIPVSERLPEPNEDGSVNAVLVTNGFVIHMAYFNNKNWWFCESGQAAELMFYVVTHWMPLPEPPKEGE